MLGRFKLYSLVLSIASAATVLAYGSAKPAPPRQETASKPLTAPALPVPPGWRTEDGAYPPAWAKELPWKGDLRLRFSPGMFKAGDTYFWSYVILYWLDGDVLKTRGELERALRVYDAGLYDGAMKASEIQIKIAKDEKAEKLKHPVIRRSVTLQGFDPFATKKPLTTHLEVFRWYCAQKKKTALFILRSARPFSKDDTVWNELQPFYNGFQCHEDKH